MSKSGIDRYDHRMSTGGRLRIGEFSRRVGESALLLRAWETRYGVVSPERTPGGLRLYSERDEQRVRTMRRHINAGLSAAEAARLTKLDDQAEDRSELPSLTDVQIALERSIDALDEPAAQAALDQLMIAVGPRAALSELILPFLRRVGDRWAAGEITVADEHFASNIVSGCLRRLAHGWGEGVGPLALLACPPGEQHELGLLSFGLALRERGWRITYLGANTPIDAIRAHALTLSPAIVVLSAVDPQRFLGNAEALTALASVVRVGLGGAGISRALAERLHAEPLTGDLIEIANNLKP